jgi:serine/threonine protein kinase/tetratricopeptide (TPR) repeat protein
MSQSQVASAPDFGPRYRVEGKLGEGGMGSVYKAYDLELDRVVALKIIRPELMANSEILQRFKQELLLASRISHKNVLRIHDLGEGVGVKFISMAYVEGRNLAEMLQEQRVLPTDRAVEIGKQICQALAAAHREGVVHRDLKPQNILIDQSGCVYVSDFGLAKSLEAGAMAATAMTAVGQVLGTPRYMSPEQVECGDIDGRTDIYSFGLILYEMVTGDVPFRGNSLQLMLGRVQSLPRNPSLVNSKLSAYLVSVIMRCLEKDPERRYQTFDRVLDDLESGRFTPAGKAPARRSPPWWSAKATTAVLGILLVASGLELLWRYLPLARSGHLGNATTVIPDKRLAILPFRIVGDDQKLAEIGLGVNDALNAKFTGLKDLEVASSTALQKVNASDSVQKVAHDLGANLVVSGSIQGSGDRLQIVVNLDDVAKGERLFTQEFPGMQQDLLTLEDQIYARLVKTIEIKPSNESLARVSQHQTENYSAYELYLKGRNAMRGQLDAKNVQAAIDFYEKAVKQDPGFAVAYAGISDANLRMYRLTKEKDWAERGVSAAQQAQQLNENLPEVDFALGSAYVATGKTTEAIAVLKKAVELAPTSDEGYRRLGDAFRAGGNKQDALIAYNRAIQLNPYYWFNYNAIGSAYLKFGDNPKALESFQHVTQLEPDNAAGYENISAVYFTMGQFDECVPVLQKALELSKKPIAYSNLGTAYFYLKRYADAVPMFEEAVRLDPGSEFNIGNLADAYRWAGKTAQANTTYDKAIEIGIRALAVNSRDAARMGRMAQYYAKKGDRMQALEFIRRARAIDPNDASLAYAEAVVEWLAGKQQDAIQHLEEALKRGYSLQALHNDPELSKMEALPEFAKITAQIPVKAD